MDLPSARLLTLRLFNARRNELCIKPFKPLANDSIKGFESRTSIKLPKDLRDWLTICNGATIEQILWTRSFLGIPRRSRPCMDIEGSLHEPHWRKNAWLPIADDGCGQLFFLIPHNGLKRPIVCFHEGISEPDEMEYAVASSLWHFLAGILSSSAHEDEDTAGADDTWPHDRALTTALDPDLLRIREFAKPWEG